MMADGSLAMMSKEALKKELQGKDLQCHYYEAIINTTADLIALTDGDHIIDANASFTAFAESIHLDTSAEKFSFKHLFEEIHKFGYIYDGYQEKRWFEPILHEEKSDCRVGIMKEGVLRTFNLTLKPLEPFTSVYVMTLTDVTEMMGYKAALEEGIKSSIKDREKTQFLLRQYDKAIEAATLVYKCDLEGNIIYANRALSEVMLYGYGELLGKHISIFRGPSMSDEEYSRIWTKLKNGEIYRGVMENVDKLGDIHYFDVSMVPIIDQEGKIVEFLSLRHEITEVMEAKETAVKTLEAKSKFFDQVSHELRTPLNAIINFTDQALESFDEMFVDEDSKTMVRMFIERTHKNSQHLMALINSLLDMAKLRSGKEKYDMVPTNVTEIVREVYESTSGLNTNSNMEYLLEIPDHDLYILADVLRVRQIITNLISNAIKFTEWGYVQLRVKEVNHECWIEIEDTGIGIPEEKMEKIFEPFEQVGVHDQGTGLGLGIVNEYAKGMGMKLHVVSSPGEGSCFTLKAATIKAPKEEG